MTEQDKKINLDTKIALLKNSTAPQKISPAFWKKLSREETFHMKKVIAKHGDVLSPVNAELLRSEALIMKNGVIYRHDRIMQILGHAPKKLTSEEITEELKDRAEDERITAIGEIPWWEFTKLSKEEYKAKKAADEAAAWAAGAPRRKELAELEKAYGRPLTRVDIWEYDRSQETQEQRMTREYEEAMGMRPVDDPTITSFRPPGWRLLDKDVHRVMRYCAAAYVFYTWPIVLYTLIVLGIIFYIVRFIREYRKIRRRAEVDFVPDPKSRYTEAKQYQHWLSDRKRWKLDVDKKITKDKDK